MPRIYHCMILEIQTTSFTSQLVIPEREICLKEQIHRRELTQCMEKIAVCTTNIAKKKCSALWSLKINVCIEQLKVTSQILLTKENST